ncbi:MAG: sigma-54-dependent Fis family transcriptional regulator, partial [Marinilabiliales bacterium]
EHAIEKAVILSESGVITPEDFHFSNQQQVSYDVDSFNLDEVEERTIKIALIKCGGNISKTSEMLGVTRKTLYKKIEKYGL